MLDGGSPAATGKAPSRSSRSLVRGSGPAALAFGANDRGSTMIEENVVAAADVRNQCDVDQMVRLIRDAGRTPV